MDEIGKSMISEQMSSESAPRRRSSRRRNKKLKQQITYALVFASLLMIALFAWLRLVSS